MNIVMLAAIVTYSSHPQQTSAGTWQFKSKYLHQFSILQNT